MAFRILFGYNNEKKGEQIPILPDSITHIELRRKKYNKPIIFIPTSLKKIEISHRYEYELPDNIEVIKI